MTVIFVAAEHHRLYWHWKDTGARDLRLSHVDFHCDMRGLTIDRHGQRAGVHAPAELEHVDQGNFLTNAIHEGMVSGLSWVHHPFGGRRYDLGTVRYLTDRRTRMAGPVPKRWQPLQYREADLRQWTGPEEGTHLDLDWDALACRVYDKPFARELQKSFLEVDFRWRPEVVYFIYSYCSSHIDDAAFEDFLEALRRKLDATVERLSPLPPEHSNMEHDPPLATRVRRMFTGPLKAPQRWMTWHLKGWNGGDDLAFPYEAARG